MCFHGRVQGVGFRATAVQCAEGLPLCGFVRNEHDGTVLLEAQGEAEDIGVLLARIAERMRRNIVRVDRVELAERSDESGFGIRR